jgi:hypothetical protein
MDPEDPFRDSASEGALSRGPLRLEVSKVASSSSEEGGGSAIGDSATRNLEGKGHSLTCKWHNATRPEALASTRPRCTLNSPAVMSARGPYPHHAASSLNSPKSKRHWQIQDESSKNVRFGSRLLTGGATLKITGMLLLNGTTKSLAHPGAQPRPSAGPESRPVNRDRGAGRWGERESPKAT